MVDIKRLLQEILESNPVPMGKEEVAVRWDYDPHLPEILTDGNKLKIVLQNLISNAIKFTNQGYVKVSARRLPYKKCGTSVPVTGLCGRKKSGRFAVGRSTNRRRRQGCRHAEPEV